MSTTDYDSLVPIVAGVLHPDNISSKKHLSYYDFDGKTILVVDDILINLSLIEVFFRNTGAFLLFAVNGREALNSCISNPQIDIVLMDIQMPVMNGLEATREIRKYLPELPVIAITATVYADDKQRCFDAGCNAFLSKPCSRKELLMTVNKYLTTNVLIEH